MNKILIDKVITSDSDKVKIDDTEITLLGSGEYYIEYTSGEYDLTFIICNDVKITEYSFDNSLRVKKRYIIRKGKTGIIKFYNNLDVNEEIDIDLCHSGCKIDFKFSNICRGSEEYLVNVNHNDKETESNIINKSLALKNSKIHYTINSNVVKKATGSKLNQNTRIVTMDDADAKISPNMFIDLEDVEAKHGSIIGRFKDEDIFYLMSKGISYSDSIKLLVKGYLFSNVGLDIDLREKIMSVINTYWR